MGENNDSHDTMQVPRALLEEIERQNQLDEHRTQRGLKPLTDIASEPNFHELKLYISQQPWVKANFSYSDVQQKQVELQKQPPPMRKRGRPKKVDSIKAEPAKIPILPKSGKVNNA